MRLFKDQLLHPIVKLKLTKFDVALEVIAFVLFLAMLGCVAYYWPSLPEKLPFYGNSNDEPGNFFIPRIILFVFPLATFVALLILTFFNRFPFLMWYPVMITEENVERQYRLMARTLRIFSVLTVASFLNVTVITCITAKIAIMTWIGFTNPLTGVWLWLLEAGIIIYFIVRSIKLK